MLNNIAAICKKTLDLFYLENRNLLTYFRCFVLDRGYHLVTKDIISILLQQVPELLYQYCFNLQKKP